jgi:hypothetical protein
MSNINQHTRVSAVMGELSHNAGKLNKTLKNRRRPKKTHEQRVT